MLFKKDDIDFLHCNKKGKDALEIIQISNLSKGLQQLSPTEIENARKNKEYYHQKILEMLSEQD